MKTEAQPTKTEMQPTRTGSGLFDQYNRRIDYFRISVTDRCNLRCLYCMPKEGIKPKAHSQILSYEEIKRFAEAAVAAGVSKIRLTGGEPLVRKDIVKLVGMLATIPGVADLALSTNGLLLGEYAAALKEAGLRRVNISLDSLNPEIYQKLTRFGNVGQVVSGIEKALEFGLKPVKVNTVLLKGLNDDPRDFIKLIYDYPVHVRFIELMPISELKNADYFVSIDELKSRLVRYGRLKPAKGPQGAGPAEYVTLDGALGTIGFISAISNHFCAACNRLRLTPDGKLRACLFSDAEFDIRPVLRDNYSEKEIIASIRNVLSNKPNRHNISDNGRPKRLMSQIGG